MIPRKINYVWLGRKEKSQEIQDCINSWKKYMPDYQIIEWNEDNLPINSNEYAKSAYDQKKWAFASDWARLWVLYNFGGIYMDTDVEVFKPFDEFLNLKGFTGFEQPMYPVTAVMGFEALNPLCKELLDYYDTKTFEFKEYPYMETNTIIISNIISKWGIDRTKFEYQESEFITIFPQCYFCPDYRKEEIKENTYSIHKMFGNWGY